MYIKEKGPQQVWQAQGRGICECLLDFFKGFLLFPSAYQRLPFYPLCGLTEGFSQAGVVRHPDLTEICRSQKFSDLPVGLRGWDEAYSLFPLRAETALPLRQVKAKVFDNVLANLVPFPKDFVYCLP
jgi:hypothetical protein